MLSRDLEVAALSIQTRRLVEEATTLVENLRKHERSLADFIGEARVDFEGDEVSESGDKAP